MGAITKILTGQTLPQPPRLTIEEDMRLQVGSLFRRYGLEPTNSQIEKIIKIVRTHRKGQNRGIRRNARSAHKQYSGVELLVAVALAKTRRKLGQRKACEALHKKQPFKSAESHGALLKDYKRARKSFQIRVDADLIDLVLAHRPSLGTIF